MASFRTLLMLLGTLGVLLIGATSPSLAAAEPAPCHEMAGTPLERPDRPQDRSMKTMACCVACIAAPAIPPPLGTLVATVGQTGRSTPRLLPDGRRPSPDTGPPKA